MLIAVRKMPEKDCCTAMHVGLAQKLVLDPCHHRLRVVEESSRDEQWAQGLQVRQGCKPWGHILVQLEGSMWEQEQEQEQEPWVVLGTAVCH
jgi:hypothetical protein